MTRAAARYLPLLLLAIGWELAARLNIVSSLALPPLTHVATAWLDLIRDGELIDKTTATWIVVPYRQDCATLQTRC